MNTSEKIKEFLALSGLTEDDIKPLLRERMQKAEIYLQTVNSQFEIADKVLTSTQLNYERIAEAMGITRDAIYKNKSLMAYITYRIEQLKDQYLNNDALKHEIRQLKDTVKDYQNRDAELIYWRDKATSMKEQLDTIHAADVAKILKENEKLQKRVQTLEDELEDLREVKKTAVKAPKGGTFLN